jgi:DNA repair protein RecO (recombination protein O)
MRSAYVTPAIVLRTWPFGESDKIVSFLTESHGKVTGIAKGAKRSRKRFANSLEPFSLVTLRFQDRSHSNLVFVLACDLMLGFKGLVTSLERIAYASYLVEITDGLTGEREENQSVFQHLKEGLVYLEENGTSLAFLTFFELKLLKLAGYQPLLDICRRCGNGRQENDKTQWHFSPQDGGILCEGCSKLRKEIMPLAVEALETMVALQHEALIPSRDLPFPRSALDAIRTVLLRFIQFQIDREIKSASFLYEFSLS